MPARKRKDESFLSKWTKVIKAMPVTKRKPLPARGLVKRTMVLYEHDYEQLYELLFENASCANCLDCSQLATQCLNILRNIKRVSTSVIAAAKPTRKAGR